MVLGDGTLSDEHPAVHAGSSMDVQSILYIKLSMISNTAYDYLAFEFLGHEIIITWLFTNLGVVCSHSQRC